MLGEGGSGGVPGKKRKKERKEQETELLGGGKEGVNDLKNKRNRGNKSGWKCGVARGTKSRQIPGPRKTEEKKGNLLAGMTKKEE